MYLSINQLSLMYTMTIRNSNSLEAYNYISLVLAFILSVVVMCLASTMYASPFRTQAEGRAVFWNMLFRGQREKNKRADGTDNST